MPASHFFCPHCGEKLAKSAAAQMLGELRASKTANFIGFGDPDQPVPCPNCGKSIDSAKMISGAYDSLMSGVEVLLTLLALVGIACAIRYGLDWDWVFAGLSAIVGATLFGGALLKRRYGRVPPDFT